MRDVDKEIHEKLVAKDQARRFDRYVEVQNDLLATGKSLVADDSFAAAYERFKQIVAHAEGLWDDACRLFVHDRYATALALSVTCLEEVGKIGVARFQLALDEQVRCGGSPVTQSPIVRRKRHPFYSHTQKLLLAAGAGAMVNSRLDRILGLTNVVAFLDQVENGEIELLRQSCLYTDAKGGHLHLPAERIGRQPAEFHLVLAGEILAEVAGFEPSEFQRLLAKVQQFEKAIGHAHQ